MQRSDGKLDEDVFGNFSSLPRSPKNYNSLENDTKLYSIASRALFFGCFFHKGYRFRLFSIYNCSARSQLPISATQHQRPDFSRLFIESLLLNSDYSA